MREGVCHSFWSAMNPVMMTCRLIADMTPSIVVGNVRHPLPIALYQPWTRPTEWPPDLSIYCSGRVAGDCPVHLDIFAADVVLPGGVCLEAVMRQRGQGQVTIGLLDASDASMPLTGVMPYCMSCTYVMVLEPLSYNISAPAGGGGCLTVA